MASPSDDVRRWRAHRAHTAASDTAAPASAPASSVAVVASFTAQPLEPALGLALLDAGIDATVSFVDANQLFQVCLDPAAHDVDEADDIVIAWRIEDLFESDLHAWANGDAGAVDRISSDAVALADAVVHLAGAVRGRVTFTDASVPTGFGFDPHDPSELHALSTLATTVNAAVDARLDGATVERVSMAAVQLAVGIESGFDGRSWMMYRQPFTARMSQALGAALGASLVRRRVTPPKVLVLDCDGTLWDGVAVDDGIGGLDVSDAFPGRAFQEFQRVAQRLRHRGVLLALCSKNDPETVETAFETLDGMVLTDADIATRRVSWDPKPQAIADLVNELNLGLDAVVFVDDSPYEVGSVREQLPTVRCLQVPADIEALPDLLAESGLFRNLTVTDDDRERTGRMQAEAQRAALAPEMSHDEFLASLELEVELFAVDADTAGRATQLINKTNQFNLTTKRRDLAAVTRLIADDRWCVLAARARDRFGDYGIIGVVIAERGDDEWLLDTMLMSCRVLGRGVETAILALATDRLRTIANLAVTGRYLPTDRNGRVATLYTDHGFAPVDDATAVLAGSDRVESPSHVTATFVS